MGQTVIRIPVGPARKSSGKPGCRVTSTIRYGTGGGGRNPLRRVPHDHRETGGQELVDTITADTSSTVAVGLVPWHFRVQFDQATRTRWEDNGWAQYPTRRYYPNPDRNSWIIASHRQLEKNTEELSNRGWFPDPHSVTAAGEWHDVPNKPGSWQGCVDQRRMSGNNPPGISAALPTGRAVYHGILFTNRSVPRGYDPPISLQCPDGPHLQPTPLGKKTSVLQGPRTTRRPKSRRRQFNLPQSRLIMPLTTKIEDASKRIRRLEG